MNLEKAIRGRRSIRDFQDRRAPQALLRRLLDLARHALASMNGQPWHFLLIRAAAVR